MDHPAPPGAAPPFSLWLICDCCDEPFPARFYRHCEHCGFDFGEGIALETERGSVEPWTQRAVFTAVTTVLVVLLLCLYFAWVLGR